MDCQICRKHCLYQHCCLWECSEKSKTVAVASLTRTWSFVDYTLVKFVSCRGSKLTQIHVTKVNGNRISYMLPQRTLQHLTTSAIRLFPDIWAREQTKLANNGTIRIHVKFKSNQWISTNSLFGVAFRLALSLLHTALRTTLASPSLPLGTTTDSSLLTYFFLPKLVIGTQTTCGFTGMVLHVTQLMR